MPNWGDGDDDSPIEVDLAINIPSDIAQYDHVLVLVQVTPPDIDLTDIPDNWDIYNINLNEDSDSLDNGEDHNNVPSDDESNYPSDEEGEYYDGPDEGSYEDSNSESCYSSDHDWFFSISTTLFSYPIILGSHSRDTRGSKGP